MSPVDPSPWVWLRDGMDRLFHAVSVWELPPEDDGPTAVCGRRVQVVSLFDEPDGGRCPALRGRGGQSGQGATGNGDGAGWVRLGVVTSSDPVPEKVWPGRGGGLGRRRRAASRCRVRLSPDEADGRQ